MEQPCPQCGQYVADTEEFCPNPSCGAYLGWDRQGSAPPVAADGATRSSADRTAVPATAPGRPAEASPKRPAPRTSHVASLSTQRLEVAPGETAEVAITVINTGSLVDEVRIAVASPLARCTTVTPPAVQVYPGAQATARVTVSPPRDDGPWAGPHPVHLSLHSSRSEAPEQGSELELTVVIGSRVVMNARLTPTESAGRSNQFRNAVEVENRGNTAMRVWLEPRDDQGLIQWQRLPEPVLVEPGDYASIPLVARCRRNWWGDDDEHRFTVGVHGEPESSAHQETWEQQLAGHREQHAVLTGWRIWALVAAVVVALVLLLAPVGLALLDRDNAPEEPAPAEAEQPPEEPVPDVPDPSVAAANDAVCSEVAEAREALALQNLTEESAQAAADVVNSASADGVDGDLVSLAQRVESALAAPDEVTLTEALNEMAAICDQ